LEEQEAIVILQVSCERSLESHLRKSKVAVTEQAYPIFQRYAEIPVRFRRQDSCQRHNKVSCQAFQKGLVAWAQLVALILLLGLQSKEEYERLHTDLCYAVQFGVWQVKRFIV